jgi:hypothetical protein
MPILFAFWFLASTDVVDMIRRVPPGGYERGAAVQPIAKAIAELADGTITGDVYEDAALEAIYSSFEGGNRRCPVGDGGKSRGPWQLQRTSRAIACTPTLALAEWIRRARESVKLCADNPPDERLAALASGSCDRGRALVRQRAELARAIKTPTSNPIR